MLGPRSSIQSASQVQNVFCLRSLASSQNEQCTKYRIMWVLLLIIVHHVSYRELFNAAFVSCWMELRSVHQEDFVSNMKQALTLQNFPEITQTVLNLAEFMEHCEEATVSTVPVFVNNTMVFN